MAVALILAAACLGSCRQAPGAESARPPVLLITLEEAGHPFVAFDTLHDVIAHLRAGRGE